MPFTDAGNESIGSVLVVTENRDGKMRDCSYELLTFARRIGGATGRRVKSLVLGDGVAEVADQFCKRGGGEVYLADHGLLADYNLDAAHTAVQAAINLASPDLVLLSHTPAGWDLAPRIAATLNCGLATDCFELAIEDDQIVFLRRLFGGKFQSRAVAKSLPVVATIQPGATDALDSSSTGLVTELQLSIDRDDCGTHVLNRIASEQIASHQDSGIDLATADIIVAGGRALGGRESFDEFLKPLADALGGVLGASRPVVDAGWLPYAHQVGSSGRVVRPKVYIACGISGADQHLIGMKGSDFIIAVNKDPEAPIFGVADIGIVGDLFEICPALTEALHQRHR